MMVRSRIRSRANCAALPKFAIIAANQCAEKYAAQTVAALTVAARLASM